LAPGERPQRHHSRRSQLNFLLAAFNEKFFYRDDFVHYVELAAVTSAAIFSGRACVTHPLLPPNGFSANQPGRLIETFGWPLYISVRDVMLPTAPRGSARSAFTEHSPVAWIRGPSWNSSSQRPSPKLGCSQCQLLAGCLRSMADLWNTRLLRSSRPVASDAKRTSHQLTVLLRCRRQCQPPSSASSLACRPVASNAERTSHQLIVLLRHRRQCQPPSSLACHPVASGAILRHRRQSQPLSSASSLACSPVASDAKRTSHQHPLLLRHRRHCQPPSSMACHPVASGAILRHSTTVSAAVVGVLFGLLHLT
jgi:hypothetical protein